jgi:site-specific DNA-cytosine methylase
MRALIHETVVRLGEQRGQPRYFSNGRYLARAGFAHGQWLSIQVGKGTLTIRRSSDPTGKRVQEKNGNPLIDLNAKFLRQVFGASTRLHVRVGEGEITLSIHPLDVSARKRLRDGSMASVFSGAGLLDQAGVASGFKSRWAVEIDRRTADVFAENHPEATIYEMSAHEAAFTDLAPVELLLMGLPCTPWSQARTLNADGSKVDRTRPATEHPLGDMALWAFLIVARVNPRTVVLECAPGFKDGELCASFTGALRRLGYDVDTRVVNSHDHGALSKRRRTVLVATTPDETPANPWPDAIAKDASRPTAADFLDAQVPDELWWDRTTKAWVFRVNERNQAKGSGFGFQVVTPESTSMGTITSQYGETKNDQPVVAHPTKKDTYRFFTLSEGRRLFGLPLSYRLPEAKTVAWRLLGQAVHIPTFAAIIAKATGRTQEATSALAPEFALA